MTHFDDFGLPEALTHTLRAMQFNTPTPIQAKAIPHALAGKDILGSAQTGTGKTGAFGIPLVAQLLANPRGTALVMTPTRELASQVMVQLKAMLGKQSKIKTALLIGGDSMSKQLQQLRNRPRVLVGTPGRINDHLERGSLMLHDTNFLVLDETDRMLDLGFTVQIEKIMKFLPKTRQTMLFSATLPNNIVKISEKYLNAPVRIAVSAESAPAANIKHDVVHVETADKHERLLEELKTRSGSVILFMKTKYSTEKMAAKLTKAGHSADAIHGDLRQNKRDRVIANFRNQKYRILVATDVAARGLDIPHIEHVINYDLPQCAEDYIHRIGRTARAGAAGSAVCLITPSDNGKWNAISRLMDPEAANANEQRGGRAKPKGKGRNKKWSGKPRQGVAKKPWDAKPRGEKVRTDRAEKGRDGETRREQPKVRNGAPKKKWDDKPRKSGKPEYRAERDESSARRNERNERTDRNERNDRNDRNQRPKRNGFKSGKPQDGTPRGERRSAKPGKRPDNARRFSKRPARPGGFKQARKAA